VLVGVAQASGLGGAAQADAPVATETDTNPATVNNAPETRDNDPEAPHGNRLTCRHRRLITAPADRSLIKLPRQHAEPRHMAKM
jgi:hypothetical protein